MKFCAPRQVGVALPDVGILVLSQYVDEHHATELLSGGADGVGYLLKDRIAEVERFIDALRRVAAGGSVLDPEVVAEYSDAGATSGRSLSFPRGNESCSS